MDFAKIVKNYNVSDLISITSIEFAPPYYIVDGKKLRTNDEKIHNLFGYYLVVYSDEPHKEGYYYTSRFELENNRIYQYWDEHPLPV